jgi:hypothetical protein
MRHADQAGRAGAAAQLPPPEHTGTKVNTGYHAQKLAREAVAAPRSS